MKPKKNNLLLILFLAYPFCGISQQIKDSSKLNLNTPKKIYTISRLITGVPTINGVLDDACWKTGVWTGSFTQFIPNEGGKPSQQTEFKLFYDDQYLYVAIRAFDSEPNKIERKAGRRDAFVGDMAGICLDSYHDQRTGFEFDMTAAGQKMDLILTNPMETDVNWNAVWYGKVGMEDSAWVAEMKIPFSQLRFSVKDDQVWGMHIWRWISRLQEESDWEIQSLTGPGVLYLFGELHGLKGLPRNRRIELMPYGSTKLKTYPKEPLNPFANKGRSYSLNGGLDAKIGVSSNFTLDLSVNPDFGQVESDPSEMNLTAFETFYTEKRPFFLEAKNIFDYSIDDANVFYSRRIGHVPTFSPRVNKGEYLDNAEASTIISAEKFSGKTEKGLSIGVLHSLTANEYARLNTSSGNKKYTSEPLTNFFVARVQKDFNQSNTILGGIFTSTNRIIKESYLNFMNRDAFTGGLDMLHQWKDKEYFIKANVIGSSIQGNVAAMRELQTSSARYYQRPDATYLRYDTTLTQLSGIGGKVEIGKGSKGLWRYSTNVNWRSPGLDLNDIGFMQRADMIDQQTNLSYFINKSTSIFRTYKISSSLSNHWNYNFNYLSSSLLLKSNFEFTNRWGLSASANYNTKSTDQRILRGGYSMKMPALWEFNWGWNTDYSKPIAFDLYLQNSWGENSSMNNFSIAPSITIRPTNTLKIGFDAQYASNRNELQYIETVPYNSVDKYILGTLNQQTVVLTFRIDFNITPELSIQYYGSPFFTVGKFKSYKVVTNSTANNYSDRFRLLNSLVDPNKCNFDENNDNIPDYSIDNPNFNFNQLRSNLVFRWEYKPGSQLYLVWSHESINEDSTGDLSMVNHIGGLYGSNPVNVFMLKFNYWFSL